MELCTTQLLLGAASAVGRLLAVDRPVALSEPVVSRPEHAVDFYGGLLGQALFWAAMARSLPSERAVSSACCYRALQGTRSRLAEWIADPRAFAAGRIALGGICGLGATIYVLTCAAELLDDEELLREGEAALALLPPEIVTRDRDFDVVHGAAGMILALLALERALSARRLTSMRCSASLSIALQCAEHLVRHRSMHEGFKTWVSRQQARCGFAHGAAGIAHALLRAHERIAAPGLIDAAGEAIVFERQLYHPAYENWLPFPGYQEERPPMVSWCWGAPGIALSRIGALMILVYAARSLSGKGIVSEADLITAADRLVYNLLRRAKGRGTFINPSAPSDAHLSLSFFKGIAGIGYGFLYLADSTATLPLPLLLEPACPSSSQ
jgi:lantibiotic modifying enzyme